MTSAILSSGSEHTVDIAVVGAGLIGMAIALEMHLHGASVIVIDKGQSIREASIAAAGMLAADDPHNPPEIGAMSRLSAEMYPEFLRQIEAISGLPVPFQTETTMQYAANGTIARLCERSINPRDLAAALRRAIETCKIPLLEGATITDVSRSGGKERIQVGRSAEILAGAILYSGGAWSGGVAADFGGSVIPITPKKGQMLRVQMPDRLKLLEVHRGEQIYIVPRTAGGQAGTALIGATVEDAGFDQRLSSHAAASLRALAAKLLPEMASEAEAPTMEMWTGLRPATPDGLPVLGQLSEARRFIASGHYRNGVLLAPATARIVRELLEGKAPAVDIAAFAPGRFASSEAVGMGLR